MIFSPGIIALLLSSVLVSGLVLYAAFFGLRVLRRWELASGSEEQLELERSTSLISTVLRLALSLECLSLFLLIYTADHIAPLFVGAMCAAGTLNLNSSGYPAVMWKVFNVAIAGTWLILNHADSEAPDYPLIRPKYLLLLMLAPTIAIEAVTQARYLLSLHPDIIASCCGSLFSPGRRALAEAWMEIPARTMFACSAGSLLALLGLGIPALRYRWASTGYAVASVAGLAVGMAALINSVSPYIYELPSHHCPFCILHAEYHCIGYLLYSLLMVGVIAGLGSGGVSLLGRTASLREIATAMRRRLTATSLLSYFLFAALCAVAMLRSNLRT